MPGPDLTLPYGFARRHGIVLHSDGERLVCSCRAGTSLDAMIEAQRLAGEQGKSLPISAQTMWKRLREKGLLAGWDTARQRNTTRRTLEGSRHREVIHLQAGLLGETKPSKPSTEAENG